MNCTRGLNRLDQKCIYGKLCSIIIFIPESYILHSLRIFSHYSQINGSETQVFQNLHMYRFNLMHSKSNI